MEIICETSMRHVHLSGDDVETLFGKGHKLQHERSLSQPGQFLCKERVTLKTDAWEFKNVAIIGPERPFSQVEISRTDAFMLKIKNVPVRQSGDLTDAPTLTVIVDDKSVECATIVAQRHVHLDPKTAKENNIDDGQIVGIQITGERSAILESVVARVSPSFAPAVHIDGDEANAVGNPKMVKILTQSK